MSPTTSPFLAFLIDSGSDAAGFSAARFGAGVGADCLAGLGASSVEIVDWETTREDRRVGSVDSFFFGGISGS